MSCKLHRFFRVGHKHTINCCWNTFSSLHLRRFSRKIIAFQTFYFGISTYPRLHTSSISTESTQASFRPLFFFCFRKTVFLWSFRNIRWKKTFPFWQELFFVVSFFVWTNLRFRARVCVCRCRCQRMYVYASFLRAHTKYLRTCSIKLNSPKIYYIFTNFLSLFSLFVALKLVVSLFRAPSSLWNAVYVSGKNNLKRKIKLRKRNGSKTVEKGKTFYSAVA